MITLYWHLLFLDPTPKQAAHKRLVQSKSGLANGRWIKASAAKKLRQKLNIPTIYTELQHEHSKCQN